MNTSAILTALQCLAQDRVIHQCTFIVNKNKDFALQFGNPFTTGPKVQFMRLFKQPCLYTASYLLLDCLEKNTVFDDFIFQDVYL